MLPLQIICQVSCCSFNLKSFSKWGDSSNPNSCVRGQKAPRLRFLSKVDFSGSIGFKFTSIKRLHQDWTTVSGAINVQGRVTPYFDRFGSHYQLKTAPRFILVCQSGFFWVYWVNIYLKKKTASRLVHWEWGYWCAKSHKAIFWPIWLTLSVIDNT